MQERGVIAGADCYLGVAILFRVKAPGLMARGRVENKEFLLKDK